MNHRLLLVAVLAACLLGGCTATTAGTAQPVAGRVTVSRPAAAANDPCALLTVDQAAQLGLGSPGEAQAGNPKQHLPPGCRWTSTDPNAATDDTLYTYFSANLSIEEYYDSVQPTEQFQLGGLSWSRYPNLLGESGCDLAVKVSDTSFVSVTSSNYLDPSKACDLAKKAAPLVASHLQG